MKRTLFVFVLLVCSFSAMAATEGRAKFVITNTPSDGNTLTYRGVTKTWKTTVTSSSTQILIGGTAAISANNLAAHLTSYPFDSSSHLEQINTTNITIIADPNLTVTASLVGTWGTVTVTTSTLTQRGIGIPFATERTETRTNDANAILLIFDYASAAIAANVAAFQNFVNVSQTQTITGTKTFSTIGAADFGITNASGINLVLNDTGGTTDDKVTKITADGDLFRIGFYNDAGTLIESVLNATRVNGVVNAVTIGGNTITLDGNTSVNGTLTSSGALSVANADVDDLVVNGAATIAGAVSTGILTPSAITNAPIHASTLWADFSWFRDQMILSNSAPSLILWNTGGGADTKGWELAGDGGTLVLRMGDDSADFTSGGTAQQVFLINRADETTTGASMTFQVPVYFNGGMSSVIGNIVALSGSFKTPQGIVLGSNTEDMPTDLIGAFFYDGSAPSGDPVDGVGVWSAAGNWLYRSSASSEGAGQVNHVHNRTATTQGAGTDYTLTASTAAIDFGTTDPNFTAPTSGTYFIWADVAVTAGGTGGDDYRMKIRNVTAGSDITGSDQSITSLGASEVGTIKISCTATISASDVVAIYGHNNTAARGTVNSARTRIGYVRLY